MRSLPPRGPSIDGRFPGPGTAVWYRLPQGYWIIRYPFLFVRASALPPILPTFPLAINPLPTCPAPCGHPGGAPPFPPLPAPSRPFPPLPAPSFFLPPPAPYCCVRTLKSYKKRKNRARMDLVLLCGRLSGPQVVNSFNDDRAPGRRKSPSSDQPINLFY